MGTTIKKFISNKNTVTVLVILAGVIILWYFYNYRVEQAVTTLKVPYAIKQIDAGKKVEADNIAYKEMIKSSTKDSDIITSMSQLEGKYICNNTSVPKNGFLYNSQLCDFDQLENSVLSNIPDGYTLYNLSVNNEMTYANSILPGDYIDLYMSAIDDDNKIIFGTLINSIKVEKVTDSSGRDVFWDSTAGDSAFLIFAVPNEIHRILELSELVKGRSLKIFPVPRNSSYSQNPGETEWGSDYLKYFIESNAAVFE